MEDVDVEDTAAQEQVEAEESVPGICFTLLGTKGLSAAVKLVSWCKTMDVVAIVTQENQLSLHRLNWQRIWMVAETRDVTTLSWKEDGKSIVTGFADGHYAVWDIENGTSSFSTVKHGVSSIVTRVPVVQMNWSCQQMTSTRRGVFSKLKRYEDPGRTTLAPLWPLSGVDAPVGGFFSSSTMESDQSQSIFSLGGGESSTTRLERMEPSALNVLAVSHVDGTLHLYAVGTFEIGRIDLNTMLREARPQLPAFGEIGVLASHFSRDLSRLHLVVHLRAKDDSVRFDEEGGEIGPDGMTVLLTVDTNLLQTKMSEILAVMWQSTLIQDLYYRIAAVTEKMALMWSDAITPFVTKMKHFGDQLSAEFDTVEAAFLALLACGVRSSTLDTLLIVNLGTRAAENMMKTFETTCEQLEHLVNQHLRPTAERLMYRLVTLNSYALHSRSFAALGLSTSQIATMMEVSKNMISHCANFVLHLTRSRQLYMNFLKWIYLNTIEEGEEKPSNITIDTFYIGQFLKGDIRADPIGQLIRGSMASSSCPSAPVSSNQGASHPSTAGGSAPSFISSKPAGSFIPPIPGLPAATASSQSNVSSFQTSNSSASATTKAAATSAPIAFKSLDESTGLDMDESLNYGDMSIDPIEDANMSMVLSDAGAGGNACGGFLSTPQRGAPAPSSWKPPMTSSPESSNMGPIQLIDLPSSLLILPDESTSPRTQNSLNINQVSAKMAIEHSTAAMPSLKPTIASIHRPQAFQSLHSFSFSGLRNAVHREAESLFNSISKSLSSHFKLDNMLLLFTRPELLKSDELTEVFPMSEFVPLMQSEHSFEFVEMPNAPQSTTACLLFKDASTLWVIRLQQTDSFSVSGIELSSHHDDENEAFSDELLIDVKYYKDSTLMALLRPEQQNRAQIQKLSLGNLEYYTSKIDVANASQGMINYFDDVVMMHPFQHTSEETILQKRDFSLDALSLHLSGPRGVGFILGAPRKCLLLDFENDEVAEEEEAEADGEENEEGETEEA